MEAKRHAKEQIAWAKEMKRVALEQSRQARKEARRLKAVPVSEGYRGDSGVYPEDARDYKRDQDDDDDDEDDEDEDDDSDSLSSEGSDDADDYSEVDTDGGNNVDGYGSDFQPSEHPTPPRQLRRASEGTQRSSRSNSDRPSPSSRERRPKSGTKTAQRQKRSKTWAGPEAIPAATPITAAKTSTATAAPDQTGARKEPPLMPDYTDFGRQLAYLGSDIAAAAKARAYQAAAEAISSAAMTASAA
ncbi:hypothetical protein BGW38_009686, partial [Lunasporangiospora selenospora]